ncbi:MAG: hypothetical protein L6Q29_05050 [Candidatus Pacebacteria bacterium]|nr:hypothetical protein [Candidatus Paceibacterota bacterium]
MEIPEIAQALINNELQTLLKSSEYSLSPQTRVEIYEALGVSNFSYNKIVDETLNSDPLPNLSIGDLSRVQISLTVARKVAMLWGLACQESDLHFKRERDKSEEEIYLHRLKSEPIENIPDIPRAFVPSHILEMAERALAGNIQNYRTLRFEANELWLMYPRPEQVEREFFIKWATQDALYEVIGWKKYNYDEPPAEDALYAFAGIFEGNDFHNRRCRLDKNKEHEFWHWWLSEAIPQSVSKVDVS